MIRCSTTHGPYRCKHPVSHDGDCEAEDQSRPLTVRVDLDARRELSRAAKYITRMVDDLTALRNKPCAHPGASAACPCCMHTREVLAAILEAS